MIPFNVPTITRNEEGYLHELIQEGRFLGKSEFTRRCERKLEQITGAKQVLLTSSCTHALELAALLTGIGRGDEVIMPSFTFSSTANAFALRGARIIFVDIDPKTMNIDPECAINAITPRTKVIVPMHYGGLYCDLSPIMEEARSKDIYVVEDAAQCIGAYAEGQHLGTDGNAGCLSFHESKNLHCGEGGALLLNDEKWIERAEIIREKGTNRSQFYRGEVDKYTWMDVGSSYLPSELAAAFLLGQLEEIESINQRRRHVYSQYLELLEPLAAKKDLEIPYQIEGCEHNAHVFWIKLNDSTQRHELVSHLKTQHIAATFHYIPLHSSPAGLKYGEFRGDDKFTTKESERLLRLPLHHGLTTSEVKRVVEEIKSFLDH